MRSNVPFKNLNYVEVWIHKCKIGNEHNIQNKISYFKFNTSISKD